MTSAPGVVGAASRTSPSVRPSHEAHPLAGRISKHRSTKLLCFLFIQPFKKAHPDGEQRIKNFGNTTHDAPWAAASSAFRALPALKPTAFTTAYRMRTKILASSAGRPQAATAAHTVTASVTHPPQESGRQVSSSATSPRPAEPLCRFRRHGSGCGKRSIGHAEKSLHTHSLFLFPAPLCGFPSPGKLPQVWIFPMSPHIATAEPHQGKSRCPGIRTGFYGRPGLRAPASVTSIKRACCVSVWPVPPPCSRPCRTRPGPEDPARHRAKTHPRTHGGELPPHVPA